MNEQAIVPARDPSGRFVSRRQDADGFLAAIDRGHAALQEARDLFEFILVRDNAAAIAAAAAALKRRDIQAQASVLVMDCDRALYKAFPGQQGKSLERQFAQGLGEVVSIKWLARLRQIHEHIDDDQYSELKAQAIASHEPLSQHRLQQLVKVKREHEARDRRFAIDTLPRADSITLIEASCAGLVDLIDEASVDWIITDPPYAKELLPTWSELAQFAEHALKPGGSLLAMSGKFYLPEVMDRLREAPSLSYQWTLCYHMPGATTRSYQRRTTGNWKPILWFVKGEYSGEWVHDTVGSPQAGMAQDTRFHKWGQNVEGVSELVNRFAAPGDTVCDPFVGGGTMALAAVNRGCAFIGADIDPKAISTTKERLGIPAEKPKRKKSSRQYLYCPGLRAGHR